MGRRTMITSAHRTKKAAERQAKKVGGVVVKTPKWARNLIFFKGKPYSVRS